jgi:hypothetical protein
VVDSVKQYNLAGVAANVELGKQGPVIQGSAGAVSFKDKNGNASVVAIAQGTDATHAVNLSQLDSLSSDKLSFVTTSVDYNSGNVTIGNIEANTYILSVSVEKTSTWTGADANTEITVGDSSNASSLFSGFDVDAQSTLDLTQLYSSAETLSITVTQGAASAGRAKVTVWYSGKLV